MSLIKKYQQLVELQVNKIKEEVSIIDFTSMISDAIEEERLIKGAGEELLKNLEKEYNKFIEEMADDLVHKELINEINKLLQEKEEERLIAEVTDLDDLEEVLPEEVPEDDLEYVISNQLKEKYIRIEQTIGFYPEDQVWLYKNFFGLDINNAEELEKAEQQGIFREMMSW